MKPPLPTFKCEECKTYEAWQEKNKRDPERWHTFYGPKTHDEHLSRKIMGTGCCGLFTFEGLHVVRGVEDVRTLAEMVYGDHNGGQLLFTVADYQDHTERKGIISVLKAGGAEKVKEFFNPNSGHYVTIMLMDGTGPKNESEWDGERDGYGCCEDCDRGNG